MAQASTSASFGYIPELDGLRAVAVLLVLVAHLGLGSIVPGGFGVTLFFFVSGLLITRLLLAEIRQSGRLNLGHFYVRRYLRLTPALIASIVIGQVAIAASGDATSPLLILSLLLYFFNYYGLFMETVDPGFAAPMPFGVYWSLSVEEHYYLAFPVVLEKLRSNRARLVGLIIAVSMMVLIWRMLIAGMGGNFVTERIYRSTDTRIDSILYGALLAILMDGPRADACLRFLTRRSVLLGAACVLLACFLVRNPYFRNVPRYSLQGMALMPLLAAICFTGQLRRVSWILRTPPMIWIGRLSYSIYLFHTTSIMIVGQVLPEASRIGSSILAVLLTVTLAAGSYFAIERRLVGIRTRFGSHVAKSKNKEEDRFLDVQDSQIESSRLREGLTFRSDKG